MNAHTSIVAAPESAAGDLSPAASVQFGLVRLWDHDLAIRAEHVREVVPRPPALQPAFAPDGAFVGTIVVRGQVVPVVDISSAVGFVPGEGQPEVVVVLRHHRELIGLLVHAVLGLHRADTADIQDFLFDAGRSVHVVTGSFALRDGLVGIIDAAAVARLPGVPRVTELMRAPQAGALLRQRKILLLTVAGAELALDADLIVATVPGSHVQPAPSISGDWVGVIEYLGQEVPVIDDTALIGLSGRVADGAGTLVLILRLGEDRLLGLKAERVRRIMAVHDRDIQPLPDSIAAGMAFFAGSVADGSGAHSLLLRTDAIRGDAGLQAIARLTRRTQDPAMPGQDRGSAGDARGTGAGREPFIVFRLGHQRRACRLAEIAQIIPLPTDHGRLACPGSPLRGLASYAGRPLSLVEMGPTIDLTASQDGRMVLVVDTEGSAIGYVVDALETIARAVAQEVPAIMQPVGEAGSSFIQVITAGREEAVRVMSLERGTARHPS